MIVIIFIGIKNKTNEFIQEALENTHQAQITYSSPAQIFKNPSVIDNHNTDLVIVDLNTSSGLGHAPDNIRKLNKHIAPVPILVLHQYDSEKFIKPIIKAGAKAIISSTPTEQELTTAIETIQEGTTYYPSESDF